MENDAPAASESAAAVPLDEQPAERPVAEGRERIRMSRDERAAAPATYEIHKRLQKRSDSESMKRS